MLPEIGGILKKYALHWILLCESLKVPFCFWEYCICNIDMCDISYFTYYSSGVQRNCGSNNIDTKPCAAPLKRFTMTLGSVHFIF